MASEAHSRRERQFSELGQITVESDVTLDDQEQPLKMSQLPTVDYTQVHPSEKQPRNFFQEQKIAELAQKIKSAGGLLNPITVRPHRKAGHYWLENGERRWRAIQHLVEEEGREEFRKMPFILTDAELPKGHRDATNLSILMRQYVEDQGKEKLVPLDAAAHVGEVARHFERERGMEPTADRLAELLGDHPKDVQRLLRIAGELTHEEMSLLRDLWGDVPRSVLLSLVRWLDAQNAASGPGLTPEEREAALRHLAKQQPPANNVGKALRGHAATSRAASARGSARAYRKATVSRSGGIRATFKVPVNKMTPQEVERTIEKAEVFVDQMRAVLEDLR